MKFEQAHEQIISILVHIDSLKKSCIKFTNHEN